MPDRPRPTLPTADRIQLGMELRRLRDAAGKTIDQVSRDLTAQLGGGFSPTKLSRLETGKRPASQRDVRDLCLYYGASADEIDHLIEMARASRVQNRWQGLSEAYAEFMALEQIAVGVRTFEALLVPGLLQTTDYSRAMAIGSALDWTAVGGEGGDLDIKLEARLARQQRLYDDPAMKLDVIIDEYVIHRRIGGAGVMAAQLRHLQDVSKLPNVDIQVIPISRGAYPGLECLGFSILDFAPGTHTQDYACYMENFVGSVWAEREAERLRVTRVFEYMKGLALNTADTREVLDRVLRGLREGED